MTKERDVIFEESASFIRESYSELGKSEKETRQRLREIRQSIEATGTYSHNAEELEYGAKVAWRNNSRCIGRLFWQTLHIFDQRQLKTEKEIAEALFGHIDYATNGGNIRPAITFFAPEQEDRNIRIWNHQLIRYAGYKTATGIVGDPASVDFTRQCQRLGWHGQGTPFDVLPLVIQVNGQEPQWFKIPEELILEIPLTHPDIKDFSKLKLRWYAVPIISDMKLEIGGISYTAAPFNGWYMETEIGARNLADTKRYNQLPGVADLMGLDRSTNTSLWKDRAMVELNAAVLHSYKQYGVSIVDHHTASEQFMRFVSREEEKGRMVNGRWSWLIPPLSPSASPVWHRSFEEVHLKPGYFYQECPYEKESPHEPDTSGEDFTAHTPKSCPFH
ncbi:nitric oxide synthase oxygenase [Paenibacillus larvae]|nr:nitric oxide synthase oxygenase [Paenibacillus larvae]AQR76959.1 nitric oxide synthase [Paenibacillus larvae subsp. larvae]AQZ48444.1 nitric oxide synthase [Paenibacillus larvae subsp. pulvifaciens]ARF70129.1 nitric oxide synthase [Paenibacillus larvae subsp. pulvifaciens]AVF22120.1 nitric oxide synthase oxygenase Nos [Paenibacillus larvae subsp. larvae]AVF26453.1 nitric oxide synthase oxygenase Nos [Paenibacillus larvae subsp. larvae]